MKLYHFVLLFAVFMAAVMIVTSVSAGEGIYVSTDTGEKELAFDKAVDAATAALSGKEGTEGRQAAADAFFTSLYASFGLLDMPKGRKDLEIYVPVIAVTEEDGFYCLYEREATDASGFTSSEKTWTDKIPYAYEDSRFVYRFLGGTRVAVMDVHNLISPDRAVYEADVSEMSESEYLPLFEAAVPLGDRADSIIFSPSLFEEVRDRVMADTIEEYLNYYCNAHNRIARESGIEYAFSLPDIDSSMYLRAVNKKSFLAFFQGYRVAGTDGFYNRYAVSNAQVKERGFYAVDDTLTYHREGCTHAGTITGYCYTKEECAREGAYACDMCFPDTGAHRN